MCMSGANCPNCEIFTETCSYIISGPDVHRVFVSWCMHRRACEAPPIRCARKMFIRVWTERRELCHSDCNLRMPKPNLAINVGISNFQRHVPTFVNQICYSPCEFLHAEGRRPNAAARSLTHELAFASIEDERLLVNGKVQFVCWSAGHVESAIYFRPP